MNPNDMTIEAIRDELARREKWRFTYSKHFNAETWQRGESDLGYNGHPIPATLDEAAKLPEGWELCVLDVTGTKNYRATAWKQRKGNARQAEGDTELLARFRLRLACTLADEGSKT